MEELMEKMENHFWVHMRKVVATVTISNAKKKATGIGVGARPHVT